MVCVRKPPLWYQEAQGENAPEGGAYGAVHQSVLGGALHPENARVYFLDESQCDAGEHVEQQQVHHLGEHKGCVTLRGCLVEIAVEDGHPEVKILGGADATLNGAHHDEQEPAEGDAAVHIAETPVFLADAQVEQTLREHLPDGWQQLDREDVLQDDGPLKPVELAYPAYIFIYTDAEKSESAQHEWEHKRMKILHYPKISVVLDKIWRILMIRERRLTPLGHTRVHLPQSIHFCSSCSSWSYWPLLK